MKSEAFSIKIKYLVRLGFIVVFVVCCLVFFFLSSTGMMLTDL